MSSSKNAYVICLDVGAGMSIPEVESGDEENTVLLDRATACISMILQRRIFTQSKDEYALVLFGSRTTDNPLADGDQYQHIRIVRELDLPDWDLVKFVDSQIEASEEEGDFLDALVVSLDLIHRASVEKKFNETSVVLLSNLAGSCNRDMLDPIISSFKSMQCDIVFIGPDLGGSGSAENGDMPTSTPGPSTSNEHQHEHLHRKQTTQQLAGERIMRQILSTVPTADAYSFREAMKSLGHFDKKQVRPVGWKCCLQITDAVEIPIRLFKKVTENRLTQSWRKVFGEDVTAEIKTERTYRVADDETEEVDKDDIGKGYAYGTTIVPFAKLDYEQMKYKADSKAFQIIGFPERSDVPNHLISGDSSWVVFPEAGDEAAATALAAVIEALDAEKRVGLVRYVYSARSSPTIGALIPVVKGSKRFLVFVHLPYSDDLRTSLFRPYSEMPAPTAEQQVAVDSLIAAMEIPQTSSDGTLHPDAEPHKILNPYIQRVYFSLQERVLHPDNPLPEIPAHLRRAVEPDPHVLQSAAPALERIRAAFRLTEIRKRKQDENDADNSGEPSNKLAKPDETDAATSIDELGRITVDSVSTLKPVEDFLAMLKQPDTPFDVAFTSMADCIRKLVTQSYRATLYMKAISCLRTLREQTTQASQARYYNDYIAELRGELPPVNRRDFFELLLKENLGAITKEESASSNLSAEDAKRLHEQPRPTDTPVHNPAPVPDADDHDDPMSLLE